MPHEKQSFLITQLTDDLTWLFNLNLHLLFINFVQLLLQSLYYEVIELDIISKSGNIDEVRGNKKATNLLTYLDVRISWVLADRWENRGWGLRLVRLIMNGMRECCNRQIAPNIRATRTTTLLSRCLLLVLTLYCPDWGYLNI